MSRQVKTYFSLGVAALVLVIASLCLLAFGDIQLSFGQVLKTLFGDTSDNVASIVVWEFRFPNLLASLITGGALATSGLILQTLTRNPLADSSILGINAGASLGAVVLLTVASQIPTLDTSRWLPLAALAGALVSGFLVMLVNRQASPIKVLLGGVALTSALNGIILMLELQMNRFDFHKILVWINGSFWNKSVPFLSKNAIFAVILLLLVILMVPTLNSFTLGQGMALGIGVNVKVAQRLLLLLAVGLATVAISVGGAISFVGLMAPNIAKRFMGERIQYLLPMSWLLGSCIMVLSEFVAVNGFGNVELPVGLVVAVITMPYFIYQLFTQKAQQI